jgi:hypothetical protein
MGFFTLEGYTLAAYFDSLNNTFTVVRADMEKRIWVKERVQIVKARLTFTMTILLDGPEYVFYLDGKELARWKAGSGKILPLGLQAQGGKVTYDQLKVRVKP